MSDQRPPRNVPALTEEQIKELATLTPARLAVIRSSAREDYPVLAGLVEATDGGIIEYDPETSQYLIDGVPIPEDVIRAIIEDQIEEEKITTRDILHALVIGFLDLNILKIKILEDVRRVNVVLHVLGRGGWAGLNLDDFDTIGNVIRDIFTQADELVEAWLSGGISQKMLESRLDVVADTGNTAYWVGRTETAEEVGFTEEIRILDPLSSGHCPECLALAGHPEKIGTLPEPGLESRCGARCRCSKEYLKPDDPRTVI